MAKKTIQDRLADALIAMGEREVPSRSKYRQFTRKSGGFYFLGRSGALRTGECASRSISITDIARDRILTGKAEPTKVSRLAEADAKWLDSHQADVELLRTAKRLAMMNGWSEDLAEPREHTQNGDPAFLPNQLDPRVCRCDRCRTIRAMRRQAKPKVDLSSVRPIFAPAPGKYKCRLCNLLITLTEADHDYPKGDETCKHDFEVIETDGPCFTVPNGRTTAMENVVGLTAEEHEKWIETAYGRLPVGGE